jgi:acyl transferase domain-containing protein/acyl carrier protein
VRVAEHNRTRLFVCRSEACIAYLLSTVSLDADASAVLLRSTFVNQDGRSSSLTAPNGPSQQAVIRGALALADLAPRHIGALEMHGTGTPLGDPIEVGAALAVLRGGAAPLRLGAAKSRVGHAEPVAGAVGIVQAAAALSQAAAGAFLHLRQVNPMVAGLIQSHVSAGEAPLAAPRQPGPGVGAGCAGTQWQAATGISAFAFQGTNAHAVLVKSSSDAVLARADAAGIPWQRRRHWFAPRPHALLGAAVAAGRGRAHVQCVLSASHLAYLWDHQVSGRPLLPGAAMLEAAHAAATLLAGGAPRQAALLGAAIPAPFVLPPLGGGTAVLGVNVDLARGGLNVLSASAAAKQQLHLACAAAPLAAPAAAAPSPQGHPRGAGTELLAGLLGALVAAPPAATATICSRRGGEQGGQYGAHPAVIDNATQAGAALQPQAAGATRVPVGLAAYTAPLTLGSAGADQWAASAALQAQLPDGSVLCGYTWRGSGGGDGGGGSAAIAGMQFKPIGGASMPTEKAQAESALVYVIDWQASAPLGAAGGGGVAGAAPVAGRIDWELGRSSRAALPTRADGAGDVHAAQACLQLLQCAAAAAARPEVSMHTPLLEPGLPDASAAYAAAAGLLKVAAQEHAAQRFSHAIHDGYAHEKAQPPAAGDIFGVGLGAGVTATPRMVPAPPAAVVRSAAAGAASAALRGSVLVTGGLGDVGRLVAFWALQSAGAPHVWLLGRSGRAGADLGLASLTHPAGSITVASCDVTSAADVEGTLRLHPSAAGAPPLTAAFHAGAVLRDAVLARQSAASLRAVFAPKVAGAVRLRGATACAPLASAVYFSSLTAQLGTPGQANYAAANAALDSLAQHSTNCGLQAGSVMWGPWASGMALQDPALLARFKRAGLAAIDPPTGLRLLQAVLGTASTSASVIAAGIAWGSLLQGRRPVPPIFAEFERSAAATPGRRPVSITLQVDARSPPPVGLLAPPAGMRAEDVAAAVADAVAGMLGPDVGPDQPLMEAGLDSLGAVELRNALQARLGRDLPATLTFDHPSINALTAFLAEHAASASAAAPVGGAHAPADAAAAAAAIQSELQAIVAALLGAEVAPDQPLMEAGLDSLGAVELRNRIGERFEAELPATLTFDHPSVAALTQYLAQYHAGPAPAPPAGFLDAMQLANWADPTHQTPQQQGIEVAAIACRYPGAAAAGNDAGAAFWSGFYGAADLQTVVPLGRWDMERVYAPEGASTDSMAFYARFAAFCAGVERFDAGAFRLSGPEAAAVDPQVRMLMEETGAACTAAGVLGGGGNPHAQRQAALVGVFVGSMYHEHLDLVAAAAPKLSPQAIVGNGAPYMVGRLSYTFGLTGPCVSTDTACSSSLVATHLAAGALRGGECGAAVAGGANVMLLADTTSAICQLQALSPVGRCKTFDASADGYGRGEGVAVLVLRRAGAGGAGACAVIRGSAVNQGGRSSGLTAPNGPAQTALVRAALAASGADAALLAVLSVHGTGTPLGDPIEVGALSNALPGGAQGADPLTLVSNKACYGHTEGTAGITGLLAALGPLQHGAVPAVMHLRTPNSYVTAALADWRRARGAPTYVPRQPAPARCGGGAALLTGTSSFGMSGVNAHAVLAAPVVPITPPKVRRCRC